MKPKKPDRFERLVEKIIKSDEDVGYDAFCFPNDVITILRNEHAWMRRMVRAMYAIAEEMELSKQGFKDLLIEQLAQRRK